jgi:hypothetical protein
MMTPTLDIFSLRHSHLFRQRHPSPQEVNSGRLRISNRRSALEVCMANQAEAWEALCMAAAIETNPDKLRNLITELEVRLEAREEELRRSFAHFYPKALPKPSLLH